MTSKTVFFVPCSPYPSLHSVCAHGPRRPFLDATVCSSADFCYRAGVYDDAHCSLTLHLAAHAEVRITSQDAMEPRAFFPHSVRGAGCHRRGYNEDQGREQRVMDGSWVGVPLEALVGARGVSGDAADLAGTSVQGPVLHERMFPRRV